MTDTRFGTRSLRRQLFGSHLIVMLVALVVFGLVVGLLELLGEGRVLGARRRDEQNPSSVIVGIAAAATAVSQRKNSAPRS